MLACNSGGPKESVLHGSTGFLAEPEAGSFSRAMAQLVVSLLPASPFMLLMAKAVFGEPCVSFLCSVATTPVGIWCLP